jgi:hypothetical protein
VQSKLGAALLCASLVIGFPVTVRCMLNPKIGNQQLQFGFNSLLDPQRYPPQEQWYRRQLVNDRSLAAYFDRQHLPDGSVLMDTFNTWGIWLTSNHPKQFIVTSDYDFKAALNRPWDFNIRYIVVSSPILTDSDAVNVRYPTFWDDGAGIAELVYSIHGANDEERFRVYRTTGAPAAPPDTAQP